MAWQPEQEALKQLSGCLKDSLGGHDKNAQKQAEIMLSQAKSSPDINNYLTYLFSHSEVPSGLTYTPNEYFAIRSAAAMMLKNNVRSGYKSIPLESLALIQSSVPLALQDKTPTIRNLAGNVITEIVSKGGILGWPQILPDLLALIGNNDSTISPEAQEGAMAALSKICEDNRKMLDKEYQGQRPLAFIIPKLIEFATNEKPRIRTLALTSLNIFISHKPQALLVSLDDLLNRLFQLASDPSNEVRRQVCRAFVQIVEIRPDKILPHISGLVDYMIAQQRKTDDEELACDAAEFWLTVGEHAEIWESLGPYLNKIIPVLLESMVYSEEDIAMLEGGGDDADIEDRAEDIKPKFAKNKAARMQANGDNIGAANGGDYAKLAGMDDDEDDDDDDLDEGEIEDDDDDEPPEDRWNLRKCSAAALDVFATDFRGPVFTTILPYLMTNLRHQEWPSREAAVLALGAVAEGCMDVVTPHLPDLVPYLISLLDDDEPLVRQITCWTLGRYSAWGAGLQDANARAQYFEPMMEGILTKMLDRNKRVQEAGASAFAHLEEKAGANLTPYCKPIIQQFVRCFEKYKDRNIFILYDCVQTLAEHVGQGLAQSELIDLLMPALIHRWHKVSDQSRELFPLLECLSYVATALADSFAPFAAPVFTRCVIIIHQNLQEFMAAVNNPGLDTPDKDFLVTSLDLLSAIIQAVDDTQSAALVSDSQPQLFELLVYCMEDPENDVRQSSYALLGDCAKYVFPQLRPFLPTLLPVLIRQLDLDSIVDEQIESTFSVLNNACWSAGEVAIQYQKDMAPYVPKLSEKFLDMLSNPMVPKSVNENAAIALGRMGLFNAEILSPHLATFSQPFLKALEGVDQTLEKATAFKGFLSIVMLNPQAMEKSLAQFITEIAKHRKDVEAGSTWNAELQQAFQHVLDLYKGLIPDFNAFLRNNISPAAITALRSMYNL
ncbi:putative Importin subunit beta-2 [Sclerotinia borealis F-4128]|uniref:Putative Importin subunit beta-2 n=1 Tax=Sclerotinia borealis (strain F-4128) TaxID=1432307 RepID=W9CSP6_SCLBF|nr:putative Importin subunit beta-2 [Sclerotinia borealis F-4128]